MLFGGTGPAKSAPAPASRPARISTSGTAAAVARSAVGTPASSSSSSPHRKGSVASAAAAAAPAAADPVDLLDFMSMGDDSTPAPAPAGGDAPAANGAVRGRSSTSSDQLGMDLLGGGGGSNGSGPSSPPSAAPTLDDLLGGVGSSNGDLGGAAQGTSNGRRNSSASAGGGADQAWPPAGRQRAGTAGSPSGSLGTPSLIGGTAKQGDLDLSGLLLGGAGGGGDAGGFSFGGRAVKPLAIATGEFGQKWMSCSGERRAAGAGLSPGLGSPKAVADRLRTRLGVHTVEIIPHTAEGICAGQLDGGGVCLVHCKVGKCSFLGLAWRGELDTTVARVGWHRLAISDLPAWSGVPCLLAGESEAGE